MEIKHKQAQAGLSEAERLRWDFVGVGVSTGEKCPNAAWGFGKSEFPVGTCPNVGQNGKRKV